MSGAKNWIQVRFTILKKRLKRKGINKKVSEKQTEQFGPPPPH